jgi:NAD(P)-dependent dehydrogenase (short-subunit alcohol dehydrogenase family)
MSDPFRGRVAVITGGAGGIGFAMAEAFAARGAKIALADLDEAAMDARAKVLRERGTDVLCVATDVTKRDSVNALADRVFQHFGAAHLVCNNAGIAIAGPLLQMTPDDWRLTMDIDFWGVVHGVEAFAPRMIEQKQGGHVLNTASMAGLVGMSWLGVYCAAKFAVVGFTEALKRELEAHGIGVSVLCPMIVATDITANSMKMRGMEVPKTEATPDQPPAGALKGGVITTAEVAKRVVRGIERKDLYILTHPEQREFLRRRAARLDEVFEPSRWELEGA